MKTIKINSFGIILLLCCYVGNAQVIVSSQDKVQIPSGFRKAKNNGLYVIAHRGAHNGIPENSLAAYHKAIDLGCDFVEIDVRTTKDRKFVSMHNPTIDQYVTGLTGKVSDMTLAELKSLDIGSRVGPEWKGTRIPTFEEILQLCQGKIGIYLDLKDAPVRELVEIIKKYDMEQDIIWYIPAFRIKEIQELVTNCPSCFPMPDAGAEKNIPAVLNQVHASVLATDMGKLNQSFVQSAHIKNAMVFVDEKAGTEAEWKQILNWGTDGIQTDKPEELIAFLQNVMVFNQKPEEKLPYIDYGNLNNWAASPFKEDTSDSIPAFLKEEISDQRADVFFIHPTSYFSKAENASLNADLLDTIVNQTTDYRSILMQATVFNGSCRVFAPRYHQGNMEAFYIFETPEAKAAFNLAYNDVRKAFLYFLENYNGNRPIIIASHSQGSLHAIRLLQEFFDGTSLQKRLVCAYVVGYRIKKDAFKNIPVGETAGQTGCFVGWRSYAKGEIPKGALNENGNSVCVNPLTWTTSEQWASPELHQGVMNGFETIVPHTAGAGIEPATKILWVDGPIEENGEKVKNLHIYDYNIFWMNIRQNVKQRIDAYYKHAGNL